MTDKPAFANYLHFQMTPDGAARLQFGDVVEGQDERIEASIVTTVANAEAWAAMIIRVINEVRAKAESENSTKQ